MKKIQLVGKNVILAQNVVVLWGLQHISIASIDCAVSQPYLCVSCKLHPNTPVLIFFIQELPHPCTR